MIERVTQGDFTWVILSRPSQKEVKDVMAEHDLSPLLVDDLTSPVPKNYATRIEDTIKLVFDFPVVKRLNAEHPYEVKFLVQKNMLLTVQYEEMGGIDSFKKAFEVNAAIKRRRRKLTGGDVFIALLAHLYTNTSQKLDYLEARLEEIESQIFENNEKEMVYEISNFSKTLIAFKHTLSSHQSIFNEVFPHFQEIYKKECSDEMAKIQSIYHELFQNTNSLFDTLIALRDTNAAMLNTKQNEVMKIFTIMAFITFPLTLVSSVFGMNTVATPLLGHKWDFWIIVGIMFVAMLCFFAYFRHKDWI